MTQQAPPDDITTHRASSPAMQQHLLAWCVLLGAAAALGWATWQMWGHPIIDLGREVYVPWQLREGRLLYRDLAYNYGPVAPYAAAAITAIFGDNLTVHGWWGAAIGVATTAGLYALGCLLGVRAVGFAAALLFVLFSFFGQTTYGCNYILPYAQAATLSMALALWSLYCLMVYLNRGRRHGPLVIGAALLIAAGFTKQEVGAAIGVTWLVAAWAHRAAWRDIAVVAVMVAAALGVFVAIFGEAGWQNMTRLIGASSAKTFFGYVSGMNLWRSSLSASVAGMAIVTATVLLASQARRNNVWLAVAVIGIGAAMYYADSFVFRAALPLAIGAMGWCVATGRRRDPLLLLAVMTLMCSPRVLLRYEPSWYGFTLYVPAYLLMAYGLGAWLAPRLGRPRVIVAALAALMLVVTVRANLHVLAVSEAKQDRLVTSRGVMRDYTQFRRSVAIEDCLAYLREHAQAGDTMVVLPEGVTLNWWSGLPNPTPYHNFIPPEMTDAAMRADVLAQLEAAKPRYVAVVRRELREFGAGSMDDYMPEVSKWIDREYGLVRVYGEPGERRWRMALLQRRGVEAER